MNEALREEISEIILKDLKDPRIGLITITAVEASPDLRHAKVYVTRHGERAELQLALSILEAAAGFIRGEVGRRLHLKFVPELSFVEDESIEAGLRIGKIIREIHEHEKREEPEGDE